MFERHVVDRPRAHARSRDGATGGRHLPAHLRGGLFAQSGQVLARGDGVPGAVLHRERHSQVVRQPGDVPVVGADDDAVGLTQHLGQDDGERTVGRPERALAQLPDCRGGVLRSRHEQPTSRLGQRADECGDQLLAQSRHLPVESVRGDPIEDLGADVDGDSVSRRAGLELVGQRQVEVALVPGGREGVDADVAGLVAHQQVLGEGEQVGSGAPGPLPPRVEVAGRDDLRREPMLVEVLQDVVADEDVATPGASLELRESLEQCAVVVEEPVVGRPITLDEGMADEQLPSQRRVDLGQPDGPSDDKRDAIEGDPFGGDSRALPRGPAGLGVLPFDQMAAELLGPHRVDPRDVVGPEPGRLDEFAGHDNLRLLAEQPRARRDAEPRTPRAEVVALGLVAHADLAQQPGQQRLVDRVDITLALRARAGRESRTLAGLSQLSDEILPLADPQVVQELALAHPPERAP